MHAYPRKAPAMTPWPDLDPGVRAIALIGPVLEEGWRIPASFTSLPQIAVDGGIRRAASPLLWAGDGDSGFVPEGMPVFFKADQNMTDFAFCLQGIESWAWRELHIFGFCGARKDHELACIGECHALMQRRGDLSVISFYDHENIPAFRMLNRGRHELIVNGVFSLLCLEPAMISVSGACTYKTENLALQPLSGRGVSNEGKGQVVVETNEPLLLMVG